MGGEWLTVPLGHLVDIYDGPHATPPKADTGPVFLGISNLSNGRVDLTNAEHVSEEHFRRWTRRVEPRGGDVVFSYETRLGEAALVPAALRCCLGRRMGLLRPREGRVDSTFLLFAYLGPQFQEVLRSRTIHGSTVDRIPLIDIPDFPITIPSRLSEQRAIAHILGTLDDKIELNRRMSETLEAIARALFKSWFVDFGPVRAREEGQDTGLPADVAEIFPDRLVDSELGKIPEGWSPTTWGELVTLEYGKGLTEYDHDSGAFPVYGTNGRIGSTASPLCMHAGIVIGRKGAYRGVHFSEDPFFVIDTAFYVEPRVPISMRWAFYMILGLDINAMDSGSAIPSTSRSEFYALPVLRPPANVLSHFEQRLTPIWARRTSLASESRTLSSVRDILLPKLISGELRVKDAGSGLSSPDSRPPLER
jgi:type I restriction enzyme, S subunit